MISIVKNVIPRQFLLASAKTYYTANNIKLLIDKFTLTNVNSGLIEVKVNLPPENGAVSNENLVLIKNIESGRCYTCPELVGQLIESGGYISCTASVSNSIVISCTGREIEY